MNPDHALVLMFNILIVTIQTSILVDYAMPRRARSFFLVKENGDIISIE